MDVDEFSGCGPRNLDLKCRFSDVILEAGNVGLWGAPLPFSLERFVVDVSLVVLDFVPLDNDFSAW